jgi:hypothetical protein
MSGCLDQTWISRNFRKNLIAWRAFLWSFFDYQTITELILVLECLGPKYRGEILLIVGLGWIFGYSVLPGVAIWLRSFRYMQLFSSSILVIILILYIFFIGYESPRWQITNGYYNQAETTIRNALKLNGKSDENLKENMIKLRKHIEQVIKH